MYSAYIFKRTKTKNLSKLTRNAVLHKYIYLAIYLSFSFDLSYVSYKSSSSSMSSFYVSCVLCCACVSPFSHSMFVHRARSDRSAIFRAFPKCMSCSHRPNRTHIWTDYTIKHTSTQNIIQQIHPHMRMRSTIRHRRQCSRGGIATA